ncbi:hypothetical protein [Agaribacterium sp. ZY112]|uniref:hypothetical protein n=1 Tax=Agaribacterium sp. ZY112 TaxID=3233574 RepID=UPI00352414FA
MKTHELVKASEAELTQALQVMKIKEIERHAAKLFERLGQPDFASVLSVFIKAIPKINQQDGDRFAQTKGLIRGLLPSASNESAEDDDLVSRLAVMLMVLVSKKYEKVLREQG